MIKVMQSFHDNELPAVVKECIDLINSESENITDMIDGFNVVYKIDIFTSRVYFDLDSFHVQCKNIKLWAMLKAYYGFEFEYDSNEKTFGIGGYETERFESASLSGLVRLLEQAFDKSAELDKKDN